VTGSPRRILAIQTAYLGDCVLTLPLLREAKALYPRSRLSVLALPKTAALFEEFPAVDEVLADDKRGEDSGLLGMLRLAGRLRSRAFDLAIIPHRSLRSALIARLAGIPRRVGFASSAGWFLMTRRAPFDWATHDLDRNLSLLKAIDPSFYPSKDVWRDVAASDHARASLAARWESLRLAPGAPVVGLHAGSAWGTKRWPEDRWAELCRRLKSQGFKPLLVGGPDDAELSKRVAAASGAESLAGTTSLGELKALMEKFSLFVTNDSGPMHVACAMGVPVLAIFGPTVRGLGFFPYGIRNEVAEADLACRPCPGSLHGPMKCPHGHFLCMKLVTVDEVFSRAMRMLACGVRL
jgi:heptosyltransferase-2